MSADDESFQYRTRNKFYRRKRASLGEVWTPDQTLIETKDKGLLCRDCHKRILWKDLTTEYEYQNNDLHRLWLCTCGNLLRMDNMTDLNLAQEQENE